MIEEVKKLINTTFYFNFYEKPFEKGRPTIVLIPDSYGLDYSVGSTFFDEYEFYDLSITINDITIDNALEEENFQPLIDELRKNYNSLLGSIEQNKNKDNPELIMIKKLLKNHDSGFYLKKSTSTEVRQTFSMNKHRDIGIFSNDLSKDSDNIYLEYLISEYLSQQKKAITSLLILLKDVESDEIESSPESSKNSNLEWRASDTDLLELIVALIETRSVTHKNDQLSRKKLIDILSNIFSISIKDFESKLTRATERKKDTSPYLSKLKMAFDNYCERKIDRLS